MPSFKSLALALAGLLAAAAALPAAPKLTADQMRLYQLGKRQTAAAAASGLTDLDILQFALTLENLETAFYQEGFARFPAADFAALGLNTRQIADLQSVGASEQAHVILLQSALAQAGIQPVAPCTYNFAGAGVSSAATMVATAAVLENVGISAYLGAAPLLADKGILSTAASILTTEARHQTFVRAAGGVSAAAPGALDTALSPKMVFSLAAPFIQSCPAGSNLAITAFPTLAVTAGSAGAAAVTAGAVVPGSTVMQFDVPAATATGGGNASFCAFTNGNVLGGTAFSPFTATGGCTVAGQGELAGIVYVSLTSAAPASGVLTDDIVVAGPLAVQVS